MRVQFVNGCWRNTVPQSGSAAFQGTIAASTDQYYEQVVEGVSPVFNNPAGSTASASPVDVLQGGQGEPNDFFQPY